MEYSRPKVTIDLEEYLALTKVVTIPNSELTVIEYEAALGKILELALREPEVITSPIKGGVILSTEVGTFTCSIVRATASDMTTYIAAKIHRLVQNGA